MHGDTPPPPEGLLPASEDAWRAWFDGWAASFWTPGDLPGLRVVVSVFDRVERGEYQRARDARRWMDAYGITPTGKRARRWAPPTDEAQP